MPKDRRVSAAETLTGITRRRQEAAAEEAAVRGGTRTPPRRSPPRTQRGTTASQARRSERDEGGVRSFGTPIGRMRNAQSTDSNNQ